ncbi:threonine synthase [Bacteroides pyogenes JCM 10003]|nr:threonine synthase [Bacteroides pyogenes JCM 10003]
MKGLAADKGLFMPATVETLPQEFYDSIDTLSFQETAFRVAEASSVKMFLRMFCAKSYAIH